MNYEGLTRKEYWFWLCNINNIGNASIEYLLKYFKTPEGVYLAKAGELVKVPGINAGRIKSIMDSKNPENIKRGLERTQRDGICFLSFMDEAFPEKLREIEHHPFGIYVKGRLPDVRLPVVAVVGARECSGYGRDAALYLSGELSKWGVQIVSGMARGIDSAAHKGALSSTFAVMGCGLDICYPPENYSLFYEIGKRGGLISEYPLGIKPSPWNFPYRNRIISGLSDAVLVVEARKRSGSLITADMGLNQGKDIFSVPGRINDPLSMGCNDLIRAGAGLVQKPDDILDSLRIRFPYIKKSPEKGEEKRDGLTKEEKEVYALLGTDPKHINSILEEGHMAFQRLAEALFELEKKGYICALGQNYYRKSFREGHNNIFD